MTVYVDQSQHPFRRMICCHMIADTVEELHAMADAIGCRREWFQPTSFPHYDIPKFRRARAVALGAVEVDRRELARVMRRVRAAKFCRDCRELDQCAWNTGAHPDDPACKAFAP